MILFGLWTEKLSNMRKTVGERGGGERESAQCDDEMG